jgi:signal transduction histidine kinase
MARRPAATDVLLALAFAAAMQIELFFVDAPAGDVPSARAATLVLAGGVAVRRSAPVLAAALAIAGVILLERIGAEVDNSLQTTFLAALVVCYSVGAHADGPRLAAAVAILLAGTMIAVLLDDPRGGVEDVFFAWTIVVGGPILLGRLVRARMRLNQELRERTEEVERDRAARSAGAVTDERRRIAGELHHLVSAALEQMVGQAAAAEQLARSKPDVAEQAFASVERTGREALGEIRRLLGVLRRDDQDLALAPQPSLAHLPDLVARVRAGGLPVEFDVEGAQAPLPAGVDLTAYRVVQEALGGAADAPDARRAAVRLRYAETEVELEVLDVGDVPADRDRRLLGIHERVAIYGGDLVAEPTSGSGYSVRVRLPLERAA